MPAGHPQPAGHHQVIRSLLGINKFVIAVEHDLSVLDYLSDYICCLYGKPGAYGVVTLPFGVRILFASPQQQQERFCFICFDARTCVASQQQQQKRTFVESQQQQQQQQQERFCFVCLDAKTLVASPPQQQQKWSATHVGMQRRTKLPAQALMVTQLFDLRTIAISDVPFLSHTSAPLKMLRGPAFGTFPVVVGRHQQRACLSVLHVQGGHQHLPGWLCAHGEPAVPRRVPDLQGFRAGEAPFTPPDLERDQEIFPPAELKKGQGKVSLPRDGKRTKNMKWGLWREESTGEFVRSGNVLLRISTGGNEPMRTYH
eukprot:888425-Pelagomonas_calceolata.AAC.4